MSCMNRAFVEKIKLPESVNIPFFAGFWYRLTSRLDNFLIKKEIIPKHPLNREKRDEIVVASLTSYPARINSVWLVVKSLLLQTYKPDRVILWLAEEQFPTKELPRNLTIMQSYGLEIKWVKDIYGHKKYRVPVMEQTTNEVVITFDDDILYSPKCIERLMAVHKKYPNCLVCERGQTYDDKKECNPGRWKTISDTGVTMPTYSMNPSPGGGCLIPFGAFHPDAVKEDCFRTLAYKNDDLWYMFMCAANKTRMIKTRKYHKIFSLIEGSQIEQMATENVMGNRNNVVMDGLKKAYPEAWHRIETDRD